MQNTARMMTGPAWLLLVVLTLLVVMPAQAVTRIAAASQLRFVMDDIVRQYRLAFPDNPVEVQYGSSGRFYAQIVNGAPFDVYLSADMEYPVALVEAGYAASPVVPYAVGRLAIWSNTVDAYLLSLADLTDPRFRRVAIANPRLAPYGARAREALMAVQAWEALASRLVYGDNVSGTLQLVQSGAAEVGIVALAQVLTPEIAAQGGYHLIDQNLHQPLEQGLIVTRRAEHNDVAWHFARYVRGTAARERFQAYGYHVPDTDR